MYGITIPDLSALYTPDIMPPHKPPVPQVMPIASHTFYNAESTVLDQQTNAQMQGTAQPAQALPAETPSHSTRQLLVRYLA